MALERKNNFLVRFECGATAKFYDIAETHLKSCLNKLEIQFTLYRLENKDL